MATKWVIREAQTQLYPGQADKVRAREPAFPGHILSQVLCQEPGRQEGNGMVLSAGCLGREMDYVSIKKTTKVAMRKNL